MMIQVIINRQASNQRIHSFSIEGHANYAKTGSDIVCAGVSAISVGTVNAAEELLGVTMHSVMKGGFLQAVVPDLLNEDQLNKLQLLLESMLVMLKTIEQSYGSYLVIRESQK
jgi:uncharacterized protein YsxB (DUF464 family)